ncbi:Phosphotransferase enzyme family protein [uncultured Desulfobacterium sp.]|uniref:Phosphotransferase enzyme family protein n=1 Tax=uncultured Desulfobacterium sp. TaxID=201089 RepID=A0A445N3Z9_9BACT|nr:Phosphotransferase enzyme family protein [uncultured Desulfobacterium sp.]
MMPPNLKNYILEFLKTRGLTSDQLSMEPIPQDGSKRVFWRFTPASSDTSYIAMTNPPADDFTIRENHAYVMIGRHLHSKHLPVPEIYCFDRSRGWVIMEDLGRTSLQDHFSSTARSVIIYEKVIEILLRLQVEGAKGFDISWCCQTQRYDRSLMRQYESNYFRDAFLIGYLGLKRQWHDLEAPFDHLAEMASMPESRFFLHRDFQSRNIMISNDKIGIVDWQGARLGPLAYDLASLLIDPYTGLSAQQKDHLLNFYLLLIKNYNASWVEPTKKSFAYLAIQRNLQILGAFSFLTKVRKKPHFEIHIPAALKTLKELLNMVANPALRPLTDVVNQLGELPFNIH